MTSEKLCTTCKIKPSRDQKRGGYCVKCNKTRAIADYHANKERYFKHAKARDVKLDELINSYKSKPCADCGVSYPPYVMDFDHIDPENKTDKISTMRRKRMAFAIIEAEIAKCEVVCANCHRERTNNQTPARYTKGQKLPSATCQQESPLERQNSTT